MDNFFSSCAYMSCDELWQKTLEALINYPHPEPAGIRR